MSYWNSQSLCTRNTKKIKQPKCVWICLCIDAHSLLTLEQLELLFGREDNLGSQEMWILRSKLIFVGMPSNLVKKNPTNGFWRRACCLDEAETWHSVQDLAVHCSITEPVPKDFFSGTTRYFPGHCTNHSQGDSQDYFYDLQHRTLTCHIQHLSC